MKMIGLEKRLDMTIVPIFDLQIIILSVSVLLLSFFQTLRFMVVDYELYLLVVLVALIGIPHSSIDHIVGQVVFSRRFGKRWFLIFLIYYIGLVLLVLLLWSIFPIISLLVFLLMSVVHFGLEHVELRMPRKMKYYAVPFLGMIPIGFPILFHQQTVTEIFSTITGGSNEDITSIVSVLSILTMVILGLGMALFVMVLIKEKTKNLLWLLFEIGLLSLLFMIFTPILAFIIYFCGFHAMRAIIKYSHRLDPNSMRNGFRNFVLYSSPIAILAGVSAWLAWDLFLAGGEVNNSILILVFVGLAGLTYPHVILSEIYRKMGRE